MRSWKKFLTEPTLAQVPSTACTSTSASRTPVSVLPMPAVENTTRSMRALAARVTVSVGEVSPTAEAHAGALGKSPTPRASATPSMALTAGFQGPLLDALALAPDEAAARLAPHGTADPTEMVALEGTARYWTAPLSDTGAGVTSESATVDGAPY